MRKTVGENQAEMRELALEFMSQPCPSCPDGNEWDSNGPTGRACQTCGGSAHIGDEDDDCPYCECGNEPTEDEDAENKCAACGKPFE